MHLLKVVKLSRDGKRKKHLQSNLSAVDNEYKGKIVELQNIILRRKNHYIQKVLSL